MQQTLVQYPRLFSMDTLYLHKHRTVSLKVNKYNESVPIVIDSVISYLEI